MATHSSVFAWKIPWTEEPGRLQSTWSQRVRHNQASAHFNHGQGQEKENESQVRIARKDTTTSIFIIHVKM